MLLGRIERIIYYNHWPFIFMARNIAITVSLRQNQMTLLGRASPRPPDIHTNTTKIRIVNSQLHARRADYVLIEHVEITV